MALDGLSFEAFFNAVHRSLEKDGFADAGRTAMNASSFATGSDLQLLPLRALQLGVAHLVNERELPEEFNAKANAVVTGDDAYALLREINAASAKRILPELG